MYLNLSEYKQTPKQQCLGVVVCVVFCRRGKHTRFPCLLIMENLTDLFMHESLCRLLVSSNQDVLQQP